VLGEQIGQSLQYGNFQGVPELREVVAKRLRRLEGVDVSPEQLLITAGSSQGIGVVAQALLDAGDTMIVEGPTFLGAVRTFELYGPRVVEIPLDERGMRTDLLERSLRDLAREGVRPKLIYTLPNFQNPAGVTMSLERRRKLLALAERYEVPILEDDAYGELRFEGRAQPSLLALDRRGLVIRCSTFSKILGAGLRLAWLAGQESLMKRLINIKIDGGTSPLASHFAIAFEREGMLDAHVRKLRKVYRERRDAMQEALQAHCARHATWITPQGGFFFWLTLKPEVDPKLALQEAQARGVSYLPGTACYSSGTGGDQLRLAFSFLPPDQIREGIARLGEALEAAMEAGQRVPVAAGARG
jgi:DNA-binding transcriptional MocR family regulator